MDRDQSKVLLVEGPDDKKVIEEILRTWNITHFSVECCKGSGQLYENFSLYVSNPGRYKIVGVVLDADANPEGRLQRFRQILEENGHYNANESVRLSAGGLILDGIVEDAARVGLWVMPDNRSHGMLEDFLAELAIAVCPQLLEEAERALSVVEEKMIHRYTPAHRSKAKIHTYLAWQKEPGRGLADAVSKHYFDASSENVRPFVDWVGRLFAEV